MKLQKGREFTGQKSILVAIIVSCLTGLVGCGSGEPAGTNSQSQKTAMVVINGAGATFPSPVYANWTYNYSESTNKRVLVNYQGTGSGAGINQLREGTINFAGTDAPLTTDELKEYQMVQFPMLAGGVVVVVNIPGINDGELKLSRKTLADIWLGKIVKWNDPALVADNPNAKLPDLNITVVHRSDSSGTTWLFTNYLSRISDEWKEKIGAGKTVRWPLGIGGQKNPGICNNVTRISGAIGYTEYTYAIETKLTMPLLQNSAKQFVPANESTFRKALESIEWPKDTNEAINAIDVQGEESYPILGITYILYHENEEETVKRELQEYFKWCFNAGSNAAKKMHYLPIPENKEYAPLKQSQSSESK